MLVNRIFQTKINGGKDTIENLRDSIDEEMGNDKYIDFPKNAVEVDLKSKASRQYNCSQIRDSLERPFAQDVDADSPKKRTTAG